RIADILATWDRAIEQTERLIEKKEELKKGLIEELVTGKKRFPGFNGEWGEYELGDIFSFLKTSSFSRKELTNDEEEGNALYFHYGDLHTGFKSNVVNCEEEQVPLVKSDRKLPEKVELLKDGDLIVADASEDYEGIGSSIEIEGIGEKTAIAGLHTLALRDSEGVTVKGFRGYILNSREVRIKLIKASTGSSVFGLSKRNLSKVRVRLPSKEEQIKIVDIIKYLELNFEKSKKKLKILKSEKQGLLNSLFS
ncbi:MAG: restriction endonuclease subunit S, partial [Flavobacteriales bacterium]